MSTRSKCVVPRIEATVTDDIKTRASGRTRYPLSLPGKDPSGSVSQKTSRIAERSIRRVCAKCTPGRYYALSHYQGSRRYRIHNNVCPRLLGVYAAMSVRGSRRIGGIARCCLPYARKEEHRRYGTQHTETRLSQSFERAERNIIT